MHNNKIIFVIICCLFILSFCSETEYIHIGFASDFSGRNSSIGIEGRDAAILFKEEINSVGGINGKKIKLHYQNYRPNKDEIVYAHKKLKTKNVLCVVGNFLSHNALIVFDYIKENGGPIVISPTASNPLLFEDNDYFFTISAKADIEGIYLAEEMKNDGINNIIILSSIYNDDYIKNFTDILKENFFTKNHTYFDNAGKIDYKELSGVQNIDAIFIGGSSIDVALISQKLRNNDIFYPIYTTSWAEFKDLIKYGANAVEGVKFIGRINYNDIFYKDFIYQFFNRFNRYPDFSAFKTYSVMLLIEEVIRKYGEGKENFIRGLKELGEFDSKIGKVGVNRYDDGRGLLYLTQIRNGEFVILKEY